MSPIFFILVGPIFVVLLVWVGATVYRLYRPQRPYPYGKSSMENRENAKAEGRAIPVGVREIRAERRHRRKDAETEYEYVWGRSEGLPESWEHDVQRRCN